TVVAGRRHDDGTLRPRVIDRVLQRRAEARVAEGHEDDVGAVIGCPDDALNDVAVLAGAARVEHLHRKDRNVRVIDAGDPAAVIGGRGGDARHPRTVPVGVAPGAAAECGPAGAYAQVGVARIDARV